MSSAFYKARFNLKHVASFCALMFLSVSSYAQANLSIKEIDSLGAVRIAEDYWRIKMGYAVIDKMPFEAESSDGLFWMVYGSLPKNTMGGVPITKIRKTDGKIVYAIRTK